MRLCGILVAFVSALALAGFAAAADPEPKTFVATLSGECPQADANWRGAAVFHLNEDGTVDYRIIANNIDEALIAGHIHFLPPGEERGPVVQDLGVTAPPEAHGVVTEGTFSNPALIEGILAGNDYYVNLHTQTCLLPLGAVRGPLRAAPRRGIDISE
jgi:CHRD domain